VYFWLIVRLSVSQLRRLPRKPLRVAVRVTACRSFVRAEKVGCAAGLATWVGFDGRSDRAAPRHKLFQSRGVSSSSL